MRKSFNLALIVSVSLSAILAQTQSGATPSVDRLRQVVEYLASDALEGRRTGTAGANNAAHYIAGEFNRYGLRPGMQVARPGRTRGENQARYLQPFPYVSNVELGAKNNLEIKRLGLTDGGSTAPRALRLGHDWMPLGFSTNRRIDNASLAFAGYGISSAELQYDDYAKSAASGRIAVVLSGTPDGDNPHGQFARAGEIRFKVAAARAAGALGLVVISSEKDLNDDRLARLSYDNAGESGLPVILVSRSAGALLLGVANDDWSPYEKIADARTTPARLPIAGETISVSTDVVRRESPSFNVIGILPGSDPKLKNEAIVLGAHYDHLGFGGEGSLAPREGDIHHGADDNASGVAGLMELARMFSSQNPKPRRTIVFIAFAGEEEGLIGSNYYVNHPVVPLTNTIAMVNMDMIGRLKDKKLIIGGVGTAREWRNMIDADNSAQSLAVSVNAPAAGSANVSVNLPIVLGANGQPVVSIDPNKRFDLALNEDGFGPSDHSSFYAKQIPVLFFWTGTHEDYHKPSDTADKINYEGEARIISMVATVVRDIDRSDRRPTYMVAKSEAQGRSTGFRVYLGTIPNYAETNDGLKLDGVRDDSPAAKAGLKAGDRIVKLAGRDVKNVYDYTYALGEMKAGQEYEVELIRDGQRLTVKITPAARK